MEQTFMGPIQSALAGFPGQRLYALVDLATCGDALARISGSRRPPDARCLLQSSVAAGAEQAAPWLVDLGLGPSAAGSPRHRRSLEVAEAAPAVIWMASALSLDQLADRLTRRLNVVLSDEQSMVLRWYDPRIFPEVYAVLREEQRAVFGAIGSRCGWLERGAELRCIDLSGAPEHDPLHDHLQLGREQEDRLIWVSEREQFLVELAAHMPDAFHALAPLQRAAWVEGWMRRAHDSRLQTHSAQLLLMCLALTHGDAVLQQPPWKETWPHVVEGQLSLLDVMASCAPLQSP